MIFPGEEGHTSSPIFSRKVNCLKIEKNKKYLTIALYSFFTAAAVICFVMCIVYSSNIASFFSKLFSVLSPFIYAFVIAYLVNPVEVFLEQLFSKIFKKSKHKNKLVKPFSITFTYIFLLILLTVFVLILLPQLTQSVTKLYNTLSSSVSTLEKWVGTLYDSVSATLPGLLETEDDVLKSINNIASTLSRFYPYVLNALGNVALELKNFFLGFLISIYMLADKKKFVLRAKKLLYAFLSHTKVERILSFCRDAHTTFGSFVAGKLIDSFIVGIICFIFMSIFGLPYASLIAILIGTTNIIPFFGPFIGGIPSTLIILFVNPIQAIWFVVFLVVLQQLDANLIEPKILGKVTGVEGFWIIFSLLLAGGLFGITGMLIAIPLFSLIYSEIKAVTERRLIKKGLPTMASAYDQDISKLPKENSEDDYDGIE